MLATLIQMTYPGAPCIYYGDEIALAGTRRYDKPHRDQDSRRPFPWHDEQIWDHSVREYFRRAVALRHRYPVLRTGEMTTLHAADRQYGFIRHDSSSQLLIMLNAADKDAHLRVPVEPHFCDNEQLESVFGPSCQAVVKDGHLRWNIPARTGCVLAPTTWLQAFCKSLNWDRDRLAETPLAWDAQEGVSCATHPNWGPMSVSPWARSENRNARENSAWAGC